MNRDSHRKFWDLVDAAHDAFIHDKVDVWNQTRPSGHEWSAAEYELLFSFCTGIGVDFSKYKTAQEIHNSLTKDEVKRILLNQHSSDLAERGVSSAGKPQKAKEWLDEHCRSWEEDPSREIRPQLIRWLCTSRSAQREMDPQGITLRNAWISDTLDLYALQNPRLRIAATRCSFYGTICLTNAHLLELKLKNCRLFSTAVNKNWDERKPSIQYSEICRVQRKRHGEVDYKRKEYGAKKIIPQRLLCSITANSLKTVGIVSVRRIVAEGPLEFNGSHIAGNLNFEESLINGNAMGSDFYPGIAIDSAEIGHNLILQRTRVNGVAHLENIQVNGSVILRGARVIYKNQPKHYPVDKTKEGVDKYRSHRNAVSLAGSSIRGDIDLGNATAWGNAYESGMKQGDIDSHVRTVISGGLSLLGINIAGSLTFNSAIIEAKYATCAVNGIRATIHGRINSRCGHYRMSNHSTIFRGSVAFVNSKIGNRVDFRGTKISERLCDRSLALDTDINYTPRYDIGIWSLDFRNSEIGGRLILSDSFSANNGVCIRSAKISDRVLIENNVTISMPDFSHNVSTRGRSIDARLTKIDGSVNIEGPNTKLVGWVDFSLSNVGGKFSIGEHSGTDYCDTTQNGWDVDIDFCPKSINTQLETYPAVDLRNASIASQFICGKALWRQGSDDRFYAENCRPRAVAVRLRGGIGADQATFGNTVELGCAELICNKDYSTDLTITNHDPIYGFTGAADFTNALIGEDFRVDGVLARGGMCLDSIKIGQDLIFRSGIIYSWRANEYINVGSATHPKISFDWAEAKLACGSILHHDRNEKRSWAITLRHASIERSLSIRSNIIFHGSLMLQSLTAGGYFELAPVDHNSAAYLKVLNKMQFNSFLLSKGMDSEIYWPISWSINLHGSKFDAIFWSFDRSGYVGAEDIRYLTYTRKSIATPFNTYIKGNGLEDDLEDNSQTTDITHTAPWRTLHSLADMLFISDLTYGNIWFFDDVTSLNLNNRRDRINPDLMMSSRIFETSDQWSTCKRFLHLQPMLPHKMKRRQRYLQPVPANSINHGEQMAVTGDKADIVDPMGAIEVAALDTFRPQPFEEFSRACKAHGRNDLFLNCQVEKWKRITLTVLYRHSRVRTFVTRPLAWLTDFLALAVLLIGVFAPLKLWLGDVTNLYGMLVYLPLTAISFSILIGLCSKLPSVGDCYEKYHEIMSKPKGVRLDYVQWFLGRHLPIDPYKRFGVNLPFGAEPLTERLQENFTTTSSIIKFLILDIFGFIAGHGYRPLRIAIIAVAVLALGSIVVSLSRQAEIIRPSSSWGDRILVQEFDVFNDDNINLELDSSRISASPMGSIAPLDNNDKSSDYPAFHSLWYSADLLIPVIGLEQAEYWQAYPYKDNSLVYRDLVQYHANQNEQDRVHAASETELLGITLDMTTGTEDVDIAIARISKPIYDGFVTFFLSDYTDEATSNAAVAIHILGPLYTLSGWILVTMGIASVTRLIRNE